MLTEAKRPDRAAFEADMARINSEVKALQEQLESAAEELGGYSPARDLASRLCKLSAQADELSVKKKASASHILSPAGADRGTDDLPEDVAEKAASLPIAQGTMAAEHAAVADDPSRPLRSRQDALKQEYYSAMAEGLASMEHSSRLRDTCRELEEALRAKLHERDGIYNAFQRSEREYCAYLRNKATPLGPEPQPERTPSDEHPGAAEPWRCGPNNVLTRFCSSGPVCG